MRNIIDFLTGHYHWFIFLLLEVVSMMLLFRYNSYQGAVWVSSANTVAGLVYEGEAKLIEFFTFGELNKDLTERNVYLEHQVALMREKLEKQGIDSLTEAGIARDADFRTISAKVVSNSVDKLDNLMTINKGEADGVRKDMGVVSGTGVVGIVYMTGKHYSVVIPVLSKHSSISCKIDSTDYFGYLRWDGASSEMANVDDVPRHAKVKVNDKVVTSGFSSVFPKGIAVGTVVSVGNSEDGISYSLRVKLNTNFGNLRDVCVIDNSHMREQLELMRAAKDSLSVKKED